MGTYDFVKQTGRDKIWKMLQEEYRKLTDPATGLLYEHLQKPVTCCVCGSAENRPLWIKQGFRFVKCSGCGLVHVNPQLNTDALYDSCRVDDSSDAWADVLLSPQQLVYDENKFRSAVEELNTMREPGRVLDVGCAVGIFLKLARDAGWDTLGLELNKKEAEYARNTLGLDVREDTIESAGLEPDSFDAVTLWEVLEHIPTPRQILKDVFKVLKPGGILIVLVPNIDSLAVRIMQEHSSTFGGRDHLWYFSRETLYRLLADEGFIPYKSQTEVAEIDTLLNYLQFEEPYIGRGVTPWSKLIPDTLRPVVEQAILKLGIGYKLRVYARKVV